MHDPRMVTLLIEQHRERTEMTARHAQRFVQLALTLRQEVLAREEVTDGQTQGP